MYELMFELEKPRSRALHACLRKNNVHFVKHEVPQTPGVKNVFVSIHNTTIKGLPGLYDNGFGLGGAFTIFRYIYATCEDIDEHWYPKDPRKRAMLNHYIEFISMDVRVNCAVMWHNTYRIQLSEDGLMEESDKNTRRDAAERVRSAAVKLEKSLDHMEKFWFEETIYLNGDKLSIADLFAYFELQQSVFTGFCPFKGRPKLFKWYKAVDYELEYELLDMEEDLYETFDGLPIKFMFQLSKL